MKLTKGKIYIIVGVALLAIVMTFTIIFANKSIKKSSSQQKKENYTLTFEYRDTDILVNKLEFIYKEKQLDDIVLTFYFDTEDVVKELVPLYKEEKEYSKVEQKGKKLVLHYASKEFAEYEYSGKKELIAKMESRGYKYIEDKKNK